MTPGQHLKRYGLPVLVERGPEKLNLSSRSRLL
jgi:hypothetical protein